ncbi:hypothetical protein [Glycomyces algeriensis]|uniref:Uncharacterized protein n=1 Tax=Glycomyces algeriensis TaxID=256037 RepID=A0A9W6G9E5_9ACTN|nr:hypothetical protein [Glycomyces algeriensis]MDA1367330.1 hypothetical protein [Glycomyces algeriensis]MDR7351017.1 hypothetical protein [Glycomyces algeriensis]GLI43730.1 hypothetical protein GALLR39Z86_35800 [Glycomyces algeriensis]
MTWEAGVLVRRGGAWVRGCAAVLAVVCAVLAAPPAVAAAAEEDEAAGIIVVGVPGLAWTDLDASVTPNMWAMAGAGASASMSVRTIGSWTCPEAGWLSLGAGERAGGAAPRDAQCAAQSRLPAPVEDGEGWSVQDWQALVDANESFNYGARLGSLADAVAAMAAEQEAAALEAEHAGEPVVAPDPGACVAGIGDGAALAAADTAGRISFWAPDLGSLGAAMSTCDVVVVDPGVIVGDTADEAPDTGTDYDQLGQDDVGVGSDEPSGALDDGEIEPEAASVRERAAAEADAAVGEVQAALPEDWRLLVAGVADASAPSALHPVLYSGAGVEPGELTSATTGRDGYVQLVDVTATALGAIGADVPATVAGAPIQVLPNGDHSSASAVARGIDETDASQSVIAVSFVFYSVLSALGVLGVAAAVWLLCGSDRFRGLARTVCLAVAAMPVAGVAAGIPHWWRAEEPTLAFWGLIAGGMAVLTVAASLPWTRHGARPVLVIAGTAALLIAVDQVSGATWPLHTPMGYTAQAGARFTGLGNYAFSIFAAAVILLVAFLPWKGRARVWGPVAIGVCAVVIVGAPNLGRDMGGTLTLVAAGILCCWKLWGRRLTVKAVILAGGIAFAVFAIGGFLDYLRPQEDQTHLGRFVGSVLDGTAANILIRKADAAIGTIGRPLTWLSLAALIGAVVIWRRRAPIRTDEVGAAVIGLTAVAVLGAVVNDSGIAVTGFTTALGFGLLAVAVGPRTERAQPATPDPVAAAPTSGN